MPLFALLGLVACAVNYQEVTLIGGGDVAITLAELDDGSDYAVEAPGLTEDEIDGLFEDGHHPDDVYDNLYSERDHGFYAAYLEVYRDGQRNLVVQLDGVEDFTPCGLPLGHVELLLVLEDGQGFGEPQFDDRARPQDYEESLILGAPDDGSAFGQADLTLEDLAFDETSGFTAAEVQVQCAAPSPPMRGRLEVDWALDPEVSRRAHRRWVTWGFQLAG